MSGSATRPFSAALIVFSLSSALLLSGCGVNSVPGAQLQSLDQGTPSSSSLSIGSSPAAYVYVSSIPGSKVQINGYRAASDGKLTVVTGSPFLTGADYAASMAANRQHLFFTNEVDIQSYSIESSGALRPAGSINAQGLNQSNCGGPAALFLDRAGATLYDLDFYSDCANNAYQFFNAEASTGHLNYLGVTANSTPIFEVPLSFIGNNEYAYGASCYHWNQEIFGFKRSSDGALTDLNITPSMPTSRTGQIYCPSLAATDATNHVAVPMQALNASTLQPVGSSQLASYTATSSGSLNTASTYSNMPYVEVATVMSISMSPSGKLLAVGGSAGLQVFHFNGADPITAFTGLLTTDEVDQVAWDNQNHLYAISQPAGKLFVFTITPTNRNPAPGSPYAITNPRNIVVIPK